MLNTREEVAPDYNIHNPPTISYNDNNNVKSNVNINPVANKINNEKDISNRSTSLLNIVGTESF